MAKIIGASESATIEWKPSLSQINEIIETVAAFSNAEGGQLFVGVSKEGIVKGVSIGKDTLEGLANRIAQHTEPKIHPRITVMRVSSGEIIQLHVQESRGKPVLADGRAYVRVGPSTRRMGKEEFERVILDRHKTELNFDSQVCKGAKIADISGEQIIAFVKKAKQEGRLDLNPNAPVLDMLKRLKLTTKDKKITNAAVLLFGKDPQKFFLHSELKAVRFRGYDVSGEMIDFKTIGTDAITLLEKGESFIFDHIPMKAWIESGKLQRQEKWLYPPEAIREALANALAHRDYKSTGKVQVRIFDDRMEIWNPGKLPPGLTVETLKGDHDSVPTNPLIADAFFRIKYAEGVGTGTNRIVEMCTKWGLPEPTFEEKGGSFVVTFGQSKLTEDTLASMGLNERQAKIIGYLKEHRQINNRQYCRLNDVSRGTALKELNELVIKKILKAVGGGRSLKYEPAG
ncbi:MAG: putative DNA binding domain-containing protein [Candidatus Omnitrophica bacterium]|nr:putative DNA binding domain-containing protein [Candidatus Omnitrophota bacterium]